jgi:CopG-like RHH_1 or ribbon-helix-helix domain, RHH_5
MNMKRTTVSLPDELYEQLRREALRSRVSMAHLIRLLLENRGSARKKLSKADPLLKVAGICSGPELSSQIDEQIYGI